MIDWQYTLFMAIFGAFSGLQLGIAVGLQRIKKEIKNLQDQQLKDTPTKTIN